MYIFSMTLTNVYQSATNVERARYKWTPFHFSNHNEPKSKEMTPSTILVHSGELEILN